MIYASCLSCFEKAKPVVKQGLNNYCIK